MQINFGAFAKPIEEQLNENGYTLGDKVEYAEKLMTSVTMCSFHIFTDKEIEKFNKKAIKCIEKHIKPLEDVKYEK